MWLIVGTPDKDGSSGVELFRWIAGLLLPESTGTVELDNMFVVTEEFIEVACAAEENDEDWENDDEATSSDATSDDEIKDWLMRILVVLNNDDGGDINIVLSFISEVPATCVSSYK